MGIGKQDAPDPPDYTPVAQSSEKAAQLQYDLGKQQLDWSKEQYNNFLPYVQDYLTSQTTATQENQQRGRDYYDYYTGTYKPIETQFANTATGYATPERANERAASAIADVSNQFEASRRTALSNLESYGIDPSQTRYGALDLSSRIAQAAASAAAGTQSRLNTEATGLALEGEAINTGRGYASNVSQAYSTATQAGSAGNKSGTDLYGTGAAAQGSPTSYFAGGNQSLGVATGALNAGYNNQLQSVQYNNQQTANGFNMIGKLAGGALGFLL
jgi:hypothetical protein